MEWIDKLKKRNSEELAKDPKFQVCETMGVVNTTKIPVDYIVLKIDGKTYSTKANDFMNKGELQLVDTNNIGKQNNIWIKGVFHEKDNHEPLEKPKFFELNIYTEINNGKG